MLQVKNGKPSEIKWMENILQPFSMLEGRHQPCVQRGRGRGRGEMQVPSQDFLGRKVNIHFYKTGR